MRSDEVADVGLAIDPNDRLGAGPEIR